MLSLSRLVTAKAVGLSLPCAYAYFSNILFGLYTYTTVPFTASPAAPSTQPLLHANRCGFSKNMIMLKRSSPPPPPPAWLPLPLNFVTPCSSPAGCTVASPSHLLSGTTCVAHRITVSASTPEIHGDLKGDAGCHAHLVRVQAEQHPTGAVILFIHAPEQTYRRATHQGQTSSLSIVPTTCSIASR